MSGLSGMYAMTSVEDAKAESPYWIDGSVTDGPELQAALDKQVQAYVTGQGGSKFIRKVLVANNGISAVRGSLSTSTCVGLELQHCMVRGARLVATLLLGT